MDAEKGHWFQNSSYEIILQALAWVYRESSQFPRHPEGLPSPEDLSRTHEKFRKKLKLALGKDDQTQILQSTQEGLVRLVENAHNAPLRQVTATQLLRTASAARNNYILGRENGSKRIRNWVQAHTEVLLTFIEKFSKVIEAIATAGGPYSSIAYETLSIMVIVICPPLSTVVRVAGLMTSNR